MRWRRRCAPNADTDSSWITTFSTSNTGQDDSHTGTFELNARTNDALRSFGEARSKACSV